MKHNYLSSCDNPHWSFSSPTAFFQFACQLTPSYSAVIPIDYLKAIHNINHPPLLLPVFVQNADDLLVASAECPSDDEDLEECEPGNGESTQGVLFPLNMVSKNKK